MDEHLVPLAGDWALWRDFAARSGGFPVRGLSVFGADDESAQLAEFAADPAFAEAVIWPLLPVPRFAFGSSGS